LKRTLAWANWNTDELIANKAEIVAKNLLQ
jgi:hypothetical protein